MIDPVLIVDYGMGNVASVLNAFTRLGVKARLSDRPQEISAARSLVLPGVGAFGEAVEEIDRRDLRKPIVGAVRGGASLLGICLGMQLLFDVSDENEGTQGLGLLHGRVRRLPGGVRVPHIGWNQIEDLRPAPILKGLEPGEHLYFVHSYYVEPLPELVVAWVDYGLRFAAVAGSGKVWGIQPHPEKSQRPGETILRNFIGLSDTGGKSGEICA
ncbi:MAG: imidazole glycerol phosphate synthase subunit HisH [Acidobacteriota bacterium]